MNTAERFEGERTNGWSRAFGGGLLWGDKPVRYLFMDEAGTSAVEPVTVVVALIADADNHVMSAEALALELLGCVPPQHKDGFVFHATQVFGDQKYREGWSMTDRLYLLKGMMSLPRRIGMAISLSAVWRNSIPESDQNPRLRISSEQMDHLLAFSYCLTVADRNIRRFAGPREVASIVAEDVPDMRRFLKAAPKAWKDNPIHLGPELLRQTERDLAAGYSTQSGEFRITRIRNSVHFVEKSEDPLVQVADACAYGFRRYFAGESFGQEFADAILGDHRLLRNFAAPAGAECWWPNPASQS